MNIVSALRTPISIIDVSFHVFELILKDENSVNKQSVMYYYIFSFKSTFTRDASFS